MRNLSFALTTRQMRDHSKTVTRRRGEFWAKVLKPGDLVCAVEKSQGIVKGGLVRLGTIRVVSVRVERLHEMVYHHPYGLVEVVREGFPGMTPIAFVDMFVEHMGGVPSQTVTRIEFEHVEATS